MHLFYDSSKFFRVISFVKKKREISFVKKKKDKYHSSIVSCVHTDGPTREHTRAAPTDGLPLSLSRTDSFYSLQRKPGKQDVLSFRKNAGCSFPEK